MISFIRKIFWKKRNNIIQQKLSEKNRIQKKIIYYLKKNNNQLKNSYLSLYQSNYIHFLHYWSIYEHTDIQNLQVTKYTFDILYNCKIDRKIGSQFLKQYSNPENRNKTQAEKLSILLKNSDKYIESNYFELLGSMPGYAWDTEYLSFLGHYANILAVMELDTYGRLLTAGFGGYTKLNQCIYETRNYIMEYTMRSLFIFECDFNPKRIEFFVYIIKRIIIQAKDWTEWEENKEKISSFSLSLGEQKIMLSDITYKDLFVALLYRQLRYFLNGKEYEEQFFECFRQELPPGPNTEILYQKPKLVEDYLILEENTEKLEYIKFYSSYFQEAKKIIKEYLATLGTKRLDKEKEHEFYPLIVSHLINIHTAPGFQKLYKKNYWMLKSIMEEKKKIYLIIIVKILI